MSEITYLFAVDAGKLFDEEKYSEAISICREGLQVFPDYPAAYGVLANSYSMSGNHEAAMDVIENAIKRFPRYKSLITVKQRIEENIKESSIGGRDIEPATVHGDLESELVIAPELEEAYQAEQPEAELAADKAVDISDSTDSITAEPENQIEEVLPGPDVSSSEVESESIINEPDVTYETVSEEVDSADLWDDSLIEEETSEPEDESLKIKKNKSFLKVISEKEKGIKKSKGRIRAGNIPLIPGLEFNSIISSDSKKSKRDHLLGLSSPPEFEHVLSKIDDDISSSFVTASTDVPDEIQMSADDPFRKLASKLKDTKIPKSIDSASLPPANVSDQAVITETIANIYVMQGAYKAAISAFGKLIEDFPEKKEEYELRISELEAKITE